MNKIKLFYMLAFLFSILLLTQFVSAQNLSVSNKPSFLTLYRSSNLSSSFNLTNFGNETVIGINFSAINLPSGVTVNFNESNLTLENGSSVIVGFTLEASSNAALGKKTVTININGSNASTSFDFTLEVKKRFCEYGEVGTQLRLSVDAPEDGDRFYAGEYINIELNVKNRGKEIDIVVEAELFDLTDNEIIEETSLEDTLDEHEDKDYTLKIKVPYDIDLDHEYVVNIKVYEDGNEDKQCKEKSIDVRLKKKAHALIIEKKTFISPTACNAPLGLTLKIANTGKNDEKVTVRVYNTTINFSSEQIKDIDKGDTKNFFFQDILPIVPPGKYVFEIRVFSDDVDLYDSIEIELQDNCKVQVKDVSITTESVTAYVGENVTVRIILTNTGNVKTNYFLKVSGYESWASLVSIEPSSIELEPGAQGNVFVTLQPKEYASLTNSFDFIVTFDSMSKSEKIIVQIQKETKPATAWEQFSFELQRNLWLFVLIFVLLLIIIILIILLAKKPRAKRIPVQQGSKKKK